MFTAGQEIQIEGEKGRFKSHIRGWRKGAFLLIDMDYTSEVGANLKVGQEIVARFFMGGEPFGFITQPVHFLYNHDIAVLSYPEVVERNSERRNERFPVRSPVDILQVLAGHELEEWRGVIRDVSLSGVRLISPRPVAVNETLFLTFTLPPDEEVDNVQATVHRVSKIQEGYEIGLDFAFLSNENKEALAEFIDLAQNKSWTLP